MDRLLALTEKQIRTEGRKENGSHKAELNSFIGYGTTEKQMYFVSVFSLSLPLTARWGLLKTRAEYKGNMQKGPDRRCLYETL